jgi:hypothetical protein
MNRDQTETLISRFIDGVATEDEMRALSDELEQSEESRTLYFRLVRLHATLVIRGGTASGTPAVREALEENRGKAGLMTVLVTRPWLAAACFVAAALLGSFAFWLPGRLRPVAHFVELQDCRWVDRQAEVHVGDGLRKGQVVELASGTASIVFKSGAKVSLFGPVIFEITSGNSGFLTLGQMKSIADTPDSRGFTVQTRTARIVDVGTEFVASAAPDGQSRVDVTSGEVLVHLDGVKAPQRLRTGEALSVEAGRSQVMVRIESGDGTERFRFPTIESPSGEDLADASRGLASIRVVHGQLRSAVRIPSGPAELLIDGRGQSAADSPAESVFFDDDAIGMLLLDLGATISISRINTYSWHVDDHRGENRVRAVQKYALYGYAGSGAPVRMPPLLDEGWVPLTRVNSDEFFEVRQPIDRPAQQACSITSANGSIGRYRYLLWRVEPSQSPTPLRLNNTFYSEFDVYGEP